MPSGRWSAVVPGHVVGRGDDRLGVVDRDQVREVAVAAGQREGDRVVIGRDRATGIEDALQAGVAGRDEALHRGDDVGGREGRPVLPFDALAKLERPDRAVLVGRPRLRETRGETARIADGLLGAQELERLGDDAVAAQVLHRDRIDRDGLLDGAADGAAGNGAGGRRRRAACGCSGGGAARGDARGAGTARGDHGADDRHRQADDRAALDELSPRDPTLGVRLDEVELDR